MVLGLTDRAPQHPALSLGLSSAAARQCLRDFLAEYESSHGPFAYGEQTASEALFAFQELAADVEPGCDCLEIGAGTGLLTHLLASAGVRVEALEPIGVGFATYRGPLSVVASKHEGRVGLVDTPIEEYADESRFDIAVSINVFEHVADWRVALRRTLRALRPGGRAIILCPNYGFPYEPHFGIPIIGTKAFTYRVFRARISALESQRGGEGLWASLNFISASDILEFCRAEGIAVRFDKGIVARMFERVTDDPCFRERRKRLVPWLVLARRLGLPQVLPRLPVRWQPYLRMTLQRPARWDAAQA